jgi:hypothetical protein
MYAIPPNSAALFTLVIVNTLPCVLMMMSVKCLGIASVANVNCPS